MPPNRLAGRSAAGDGAERRVANTLRSLMASTARAESPKVRAFKANAAAGEPRNISTPPNAGPRMMLAPPTADRAALAPGRSASSTTRGVTAATHGMYGAAAAVAAAAITGASTMGSPAAATAASRSMSPIRARSQTIMMRRRSNRSASTPPSGPSTTIGTTRAAVVMPAHSAEWVRS